MNVASTLDIARQIMGPVPILADEDGTWTYDELAAATTGSRAWLAAAGAAPGATVATMQGLSRPYVALLYGALGAGTVVAPLNARMRVDEMAKVLEGLRPRVLVADERYLGIVADAVAQGSPETTVRPTAELAAAAASGGEPVECAEPEDGSVAILLHTSGTTGRPKPIALTHDGLTRTLLRTVMPPDGTPRGATVLSAPNHHVAGTSALLASVFGGRRVELLPAFSAAAWLRLVAERGADHAFVVPTMLDRVLADPGFADTDLSGLRTVAYGAAPMPRRVIREALKRFPVSCGFVGSYGQTETGGTVCVLGPEDHAEARAGDPAALERLGSIGRPIEGVAMTILDEAGEALGPDEGGEIAVRLPESADQAWHRTGDLGRIDGDGYVYLTSRQDDLIIRGGENIDPTEIEEAIATHPGVVEVAVVGLPDETWGQVVAAFVVTDGDSPAAPADLTAHVKGSLASYKAPTEWIFVDELPRTALGKLRRKELIAMHAASTGNEGTTPAPTSAGEQSPRTSTKVGKRYACPSCGAEYLIARPGQLPDCCGQPLKPK